MEQHKGVQGVIILSHDGIPIRSTLDNDKTISYAALITQLTEKAASVVRELDVTNELTFLRVRSKLNEIMVAPDEQYILIVIQSAGTQYAVKEMEVLGKKRLMKERAIWEVRVIAAAGNGHPYIIGYKEASYANGTVYIVMEYASAGNLSHLVKQYATPSGALPESLLRRLLVQLALALKALHDADFVHRDLKSDNVFLDAGLDVKLGDFGLARSLPRSSYAYTPAGTPGYQAPEIMMGRAYNAKADVWSLGCIAYEMCAGRLPYHPSVKHQIMYMQPGPLPYTYSSGLRSLIGKMLNKNAHSRPSIDAILNDSYMRAAFKDELSADHQALFDASFAFKAPSAATPSHADDIQRHLIGSIRTFDFAESEAAPAEPPVEQLVAKENVGVVSGKKLASAAAALPSPIEGLDADGTGPLADSASVAAPGVSDSVVLYSGIDNLLGDLDLNATLDAETIAAKIQEMNSRFSKISTRAAASDAGSPAVPAHKGSSAAAAPARTPARAGPAVPARHAAEAGAGAAPLKVAAHKMTVSSSVNTSAAKARVANPLFDAPTVSVVESYGVGGGGWGASVAGSYALYGGGGGYGYGAGGLYF
ncbi:uncharacterized protein AMSG_12406 [Thecamonas trahens ATCC 50062]|uniref:non-specific serine/threonine protein kinase n=1 Tax=Thecamonas trahens ATCC 50062 TaxID=461836 RepID=A0A0L0DUZ8_THETB|nr:hypothetical protein AMSG_12406 [Thecamonas trahens ATCC 50062]KNC55348.1 hypothetical protein AMSG_12406 [Thecamonas trahens ATCC 50062]|eukprot:XP_013753081.1 hypothetical protein AMSG_12406 [Thecamonas trahens ATCC 50062]